MRSTIAYNPQQIAPGSGFTGDLTSLMSTQGKVGELFRQHIMPPQQIAELHEREAELFRQFASDPKRSPTGSVRVSRNKRGREANVFMQLMASSMRELCRKPHNNAVATMTNVAFPEAHVTAENVGSACKPTTRTGRRRKKTGAQDAKNGQ
jgi:hypothetical protein